MLDPKRGFDEEAAAKGEAVDEEDETPKGELETAAPEPKAEVDAGVVGAEEPKMEAWDFCGVPKIDAPPVEVVEAPKGEEVEVLEETNGEVTDVEAPKVLEAPNAEVDFWPDPPNNELDPEDPNIPDDDEVPEFRNKSRIQNRNLLFGERRHLWRLQTTNLYLLVSMYSTVC